MRTASTQSRCGGGVAGPVLASRAPSSSAAAAAAWRGPGETSTILVLRIIGARPSKQPLIVRTFLKVYMELGSYFLFLQDQIKDIIITGGWVRFSKTTRKERRRTLIRTWDKDMLTPSKN